MGINHSWIPLYDDDRIWGIIAFILVPEPIAVIQKINILSRMASSVSTWNSYKSEWLKLMKET
jgi:hypothetical protein